MGEGVFQGVSELTVNQNCSIFNNLEGLDYKETFLFLSAYAESYGPG
jgi:hypothetical protein